MPFSGDDTIAATGDMQFPPTPWTMIVDRTLQETIKDNLIAQYWQPIYYYLRRKGHSNEKAKDLTQGFFLDVVLGRELFHKADRSRGKFRTLMLTALDRYATDVHRYHKKRQYDKQIPIDDIQITDPTPDDPHKAFVYAWVTKLLDKTIKELEDECCNDGMEVHWKLFNLKFLKPVMESEKTPQLSNICDDLGINNTKKASNMIITVKRRFRQILKRHIRKIVETDDQVDQEINEIIQILSQ